MGHYISSLNRGPAKGSAQNTPAKEVSKKAKPAKGIKNLGAMRNGPKSLGGGSTQEKGVPVKDSNSRRAQTISSDAAQDNSSKEQKRGRAPARSGIRSADPNNGGTKRPKS